MKAILAQALFDCVLCQKCVDLGGDWMCRLLSLALVLQNLTGVEDLVHDLVERFVDGEVLVVEFGVACWVDTAEVLHSTELV